MRAGSGASNSGSIHTLPVNHSGAPSCPAGLSRDNAGTAEAVAEEDADAWVSTRFISMHFYRLHKGRWQRRLLTLERATIQQRLCPPGARTSAFASRIYGNRLYFWQAP